MISRRGLLVGAGVAAGALVLAVETRPGLQIISEGPGKVPVYPPTVARFAASGPTPVTGQVWIDTSQPGLDVVKIYDGRDWRSHGALNAQRGTWAIEEMVR